MTAENPITGSVVEFADKGKFHLGLVTHIEEKSGKVRLINENAKDITLPSKQILHVLPMRQSASISSSSLQSLLKNLDESASELALGCDVAALWALVVDSESEISLEDLVSLNFDSPDAIQTLAMIRALRSDKVYFKPLVPGMYAPRPENIVEDLKKQMAAKAQKEEWRQKFVDEAIRMLKLTASEKDVARENGLFEHSDVPEAWHIVEMYAINGTEYAEKSEAETLLERIQNKLNRGFAGTAYLRARAFLRESGFWTEDTNVALLKYEIPVSFSDHEEKQAFEIYQAKRDTDGRRDLTHLDVFSIDDVDTLDIDDALSIEKLPDGRMQLGVHIAAPASAIDFGSPLEIESRRRATSIYLPEQRIPMMPAILSENALSLMQDQRRNAISFLMSFDADFNLTDSEIIPSVVMSHHRLSYDTAEHLIEDGDDVLSDEIRKIQEITEVSASNRRTHGAVDIDLPEYKLDYDAKEKCYHFKPIDPTMMSRQLVAECMILANHLAAEFCAGHDIPALYRIQPSPVNMPRQDTLDALPNDLMRAYAMRKCMQPAASSMTPGLHAGLGLDKYIQATSPLRRYADLIGHYQLESWFKCGKPRFDESEFNAILAETDLGNSHARQASLEAWHTATLCYLKQLGKTPLQAIIVQYNNERSDMAQVILIETQIRANVATRNRWPLGSVCKVVPEHINPEEGTILLQFLDVV